MNLNIVAVAYKEAYLVVEVSTLMSINENLRTMGKSINTDGKAIAQEIIHEAHQVLTWKSAKPMLLKTLMHETMQDIVNDKKSGTKRCMAFGGNL